MVEEHVFPGPARAMPARASGRFAYRLTPLDGPQRLTAGDVAEPDPIVHAVGYAPFAVRAAQLGADVTALANDLGAFLEFVALHEELLSDPALREAAIVFFGNALAVAHPGAAWRAGPKRQVGTDAAGIDVDRTLSRLVRDPETRRGFIDHLAEWNDADAQYAATRHEMRAAMESPGAPRLNTPLVAYRRPAFAVPPFVGEDGQPIDYGSRWEGSPPDEAYSRVTHPERFAHLSAAADALVAYLGQQYDVAVRTEAAADGTVTTYLEPSVGAPVRLRSTLFPAIEISAGALYQEVTPDCGCDACDETFESAADQLERTVLSIAAGGLTERYPVGSERQYVHVLRIVEGGSHSGTGADQRPEADHDAAEQLIGGLVDGRWPAWPLAVA